MSSEFSGSHFDGHLSTDDAATPKLIDAMARFSLNSGLFLFAVAERMGMAVTDLSCLLLVTLEGAGPAGWLAGRSGLSTGAITGIVDRLERGGWVRREADPGDRRRVVVRLVEERRSALNRLLRPLAAVATDLDSAPGVATRAAMMVALCNATVKLAAQTELIQRHEGYGAQDERHLGSHTLRLEVWTGELVVRSADLGAESVRVAPDGGLAMSVRGTKVTVGVAKRRHGQGRGAETVEVDANTVWLMELSGGAQRMRLDIGGIRLGSLSIGGGANRLHVVLPEPMGQVALRVTGGANNVRIERPPGTSVVVRIAGESSDVRVDGRRHHRAIGHPGLYHRAEEAPAVVGAARDGYVIEVSGGANKLVVS